MSFILCKCGRKFIGNSEYVAFCPSCGAEVVKTADTPTLETVKRPIRLNHLIGWDTLTFDTLRLSQKILQDHPGVSGIAGIPRSGLRVAIDIAIKLGVPAYEASHKRGLVQLGTGFRLRHPIHGKRANHSGEIVLVDDSVASGTALKEVRQHREIAKLPAYAVYATKRGAKSVDGFIRSLALPHYFEWNFFNNGQILKDYNVGIDFDGVLCSDCPYDDDGPLYTKWMDSVKPIRFPRDFTIPFIVTARLEKYREATERWLARYEVNYGSLVMFPGTFNERMGTDVGRWKASEVLNREIRLFVESDYRQAKTIATISKKETISIELPPKPDVWPQWAIALSKLRTDADVGVGDTFERHAAMVGGRVFKKLSKQLGLPCGCDARQADWNRLYSYPPPS